MKKIAEWIDLVVILFIFGVVLITLLALLNAIYLSGYGDKCALTAESADCYRQRVEQCMAREEGTINECLEKVSTP